MKCIRELRPMFGGRMCVRLKDDRSTELDVARNRVRILKERLGMR
jgi:DNA-binding LytR/AlgR family response regulator